MPCLPQTSLCHLLFAILLAVWVTLNLPFDLSAEGVSLCHAACACAAADSPPNQAAKPYLCMIVWLQMVLPTKLPNPKAYLYVIVLLQMVFPTKLGSDSMTFDAEADMKRVGGPVRLQTAREVQIKVYVDHSAVEVFMSTGEALTTRYELHQQHSGTCPAFMP